MRNRPKWGSRPANGGAKCGVGGRAVVTEGAFKPNGKLEDEVLLAAAMDDDNDEVDESRAIVAANELEIC